MSTYIACWKTKQLALEAWKLRIAMTFLQISTPQQNRPINTKPLTCFKAKFRRSLHRRIYRHRNLEERCHSNPSTFDVYPRHRNVLSNRIDPDAAKKS